MNILNIFKIRTDAQQNIRPNSAAKQPKGVAAFGVAKSRVPAVLEQVAPGVRVTAPAQSSLAGGCCTQILKFQLLKK